MTLEQIQAWIQAGALLIEAGQMTFHQFRSFLQLFRPGMPNEELDAILDAIISDAKRRAILARIDATRARSEG